MYQTSVDATAVTPGAEGVESRRMLDASVGTTAGMIEIVDLAPGATLVLHRHGNVEEASVILDGDATLLTAGGEQDAPAGTVIFAAEGTWHGLRAGSGPVRIFTAHSGVADAAELDTEEADGDVSGDAPKTVLLTEVEDNRFEDPSMGFYALNARWLVSADGLGSSKIVLGSNSFDAKVGLHELHRHDKAEEFLYIYEGVGHNFGEDGGADLAEEEIAFLPRNVWHGFRNNADKPVKGLFGYFGVGTLEAGGYEVRDA